jgi:chemotaxis response regulator CheB
MKITKEQLENAVAELNDKICDPPISLKNEKKAKKQILEASKLIEKTDKITKETMEVINALKEKKEKKSDKVKPEKKEGKKSTKATKAKKSEKSKKTEDKPKKSSKSKGVGVIATILKTITEKPSSKESILKKLVKAFPDRDEQSMSKTIQAQLPNRMAKEKGIKITEKDGKFSTKG